MSNTSNYLSPEEIAAYGLRQSAASDAYQRGLFKLATARNWASQDYNLNKADQAYQWGNAFRRVPSSFARRGVLRSGMANSGYDDYEWRRQKAMRDLNRAYERQTGGLDMQEGDLRLAYDSSNRQIESERLARQAALAAAIRGVQ